MLATRFRATVGQTHHPTEGGQQQPCSFETHVRGADRHGSRKTATFTAVNGFLVVIGKFLALLNETIYDPGCGTGGFLAQSFEHITGKLGNDSTAEQLETLKQRTFWGREKENLIYPIALANLVLHGIDNPNLWRGNTLTGQESYGGLFEGAPHEFDVILTNPPFGGKEGKEAQTNFDFKTGATQVLFLQHVIRSLRNGGRCGIVLDEGLLFRTNEDAFVKTKVTTGGMGRHSSAVRPVPTHYHRGRAEPPQPRSHRSAQSARRTHRYRLGRGDRLGLHRSTPASERRGTDRAELTHGTRFALL
jgi:SAM-dependent methyltransferase